MRVKRHVILWGLPRERAPAFGYGLGRITGTDMLTKREAVSNGPRQGHLLAFKVFSRGR